MKSRFKNIALALFCSAALLVSGIAPGTVTVAHASGTEVTAAKTSMDKLRDFFAKEQADLKGAFAGAMGSAVNDENWLEGVLLGSMLNQDIEYYNQPTKIFDKVNSAYKGTSSSTSEPNCIYSYEGGDDYSTTSNYQIYTDMSDKSTNTYNYQWYNPITQNYNYTDYFLYDYDYNTYYYQTTTNNYQYDYYYIDNSTYVTYYILETNMQTQEESEYQYDVYYKLPDGRNSFNLTKDDVWGTYFIYDVMKYDSVPEDDGTTLGLWHFDGNLNDSSYWNNSSGISQNLDYTNSFFGQGKVMGTTSSSNVQLFLDKVNFDFSEPYTLEWLEYIPSNEVNVTDTGTYYYQYDHLVAHYGYLANISISERFLYFALCFDGDVVTLYVNGVNVPFEYYYDDDLSQYASDYQDGYNYISDYVLGFGFNKLEKYLNFAPMLFLYRHIVDFRESNEKYEYVDGYKYKNFHDYYYSTLHYNTVIDEMRLSKGVLYTHNYIPSAEPFTTNNVFVLPEEVKENNILLYSNYDITDFRIGGARQTYPSNGSVFVNLENDIVTSVQQYQVNQWVEVDARVYVDGSTESLKGYDMSEFKLVESSSPGVDSGDDDPGDSSGDDSGSSGSGGLDDDSGGGGGVQAVLDAITGFFDTIFGIIGTLVSMVTSLLDSIFDTLKLFEDFSSGFSDFLGATFSFIPFEVWSCIGAGITLVILAAVIKLLRG